MTIPIYRAKKIDSDKYIEGNLIEDFGIGFYIQINKTLNIIYDVYRNQHGISTDDFIQVDITTLAIHFPDMLDSQGNKIFASLSEDGKGGDIVENTNLYTETNEHWFVVYKGCRFLVKDTVGQFCEFKWANTERKKLKIIGIQE